MLIVFTEGLEIFTNGDTRLKLIAIKDCNAVFERLNADGSGYDYIIGNVCNFDMENKTVSWWFGSYPMHHDYDRILEQLERA